jgi:hypothetical protein
MLASLALESLSRDLNAAIGNLGLSTLTFDSASLVEKPAKQAEQIFQGYSKAKPNKEDAYSAARAFLRGAELSNWQRDMVASAICDGIREQGGAAIVGSQERFVSLLDSYRAEAKRGELWRLTWHGLLYSYFNFDLEASKSPSDRAGWEALRSFLEETWPLIEKETPGGLVPAWLNVLRGEKTLLSSQPVEKYAKSFLAGDTAAVNSLAADLGIPPSSWFWHALVLSAVKFAASESDSKFREHVLSLLQLIQGKPGFRDEALERILIRYHACKGAPVSEELRDFVCHASVWKNPKLKAAGIATAWNRVPEEVWRMVLAWVNERNLKEFFDILAARNKADEGRLAFWSKYLKQIVWTRLVFGADTMALQRANEEVRNLIAGEQGAYAELTGKREVDAFMMQLGSYIFIEFSKKPNACYVYEADELPFEPYARYYNGGTSDLGAGYHAHVECALRIVHRENWQFKAENDLRQLGIHPDVTERPSRATSSKSSVASTSAGRLNDSKRDAVGANKLNVSAVRALAARFAHFTIDDRRSASGGRFWVEDPLQRMQLGHELKAMGFRWSSKRQAWYFPDD